MYHITCGTLQQASSVHLPVKERKSNSRDPNWIFSILFASSGIQTRDPVKESKTRLRSDCSTSVLSHHILGLHRQTSSNFRVALKFYLSWKYQFWLNDWQGMSNIQIDFRFYFKKVLLVSHVANSIIFSTSFLRNFSQTTF